MLLRKTATGFEQVPHKEMLGLTEIFQDSARPPSTGREAVEMWPTYPGYKDILLPYQRRSVSFIRQALSSYGTYHGYSGAYLAASPGLGKTRMATAGLLAYGLQPSSRVLILGPLAARGSWHNEDADPNALFGICPKILRDYDDIRWWKKGWAYIHLEVIAKFWSTIRADAIVIDEAHLLSNLSSNRSYAVRNLSRLTSIRARLLLSATPAPKTRMDLYPQLAIMQPGAWPEGLEGFGVRYFGGKREHTYGGNRSYMIFEKPTHTDELRRRLCDFSLKYGRWDVDGLGASPLIRRAVEVDVRKETSEEYWRILDEIKRRRKDLVESYNVVDVMGKKMCMTPDGLRSIRYRGPSKKGPQHLIALSQAISALAAAKAPKAIDIAVDALSRHRLVVVFTERRKSARLVVDGLRAKGISASGPLTGRLSPDKRWGMCRAFAESGTGVLVGTRASTGISNHYLSKATCAIITAPHWNPDGNLQAEGRLLDVSKAGLGDKEVIYVIAKGSAVDRKILDLIHEKERESARLMGESEASDLAATLLAGEGSAQRSFKQLWEAMHNGD